MDNGYKIYGTDWIYGIGRVVLVTTFQSSGRQLTSEVFLFGLDRVTDKKLFGQRVITHTIPEDVEDRIIDLGCMENEAKEQGRNIIQQERWRLFKETNERAHILESFELYEVSDNTVLSSLKISGGFEEELKQVSQNTKSDRLRAYLKFLLSITIEVHDV